MLKKLAQLVSLLLHPLWIPTYLFALVFTFTPTLATPINRESMPLFLVLVFLLTGLIPLMSVVVLRLPYLLLLNKVWRRSRARNWSSRRSLYSLRSQVAKVRKNSVGAELCHVTTLGEGSAFFYDHRFLCSGMCHVKRSPGLGQFFYCGHDDGGLYQPGSVSDHFDVEDQCAQCSHQQFDRLFAGSNAGPGRKYTFGTPIPKHNCRRGADVLPLISQPTHPAAGRPWVPYRVFN